ELYVGCAGGIDASITIDYATEAVPAGYCAYKLIVGGLKGGHSGMDIILGRGNANKILFRLLRWVAECGIRLESIDGGSLRNAIPREASAVLVFPTEHKDCILKEFDKVAEAVAKELEAVDGDFFMKYEAVDMPKAVMTEADTNRCINLVYAAPNGVMRMSDSMPGLVETSLNMAIVKTDGNKMSIHSLLRSSVDSAKEDLAERLVCLAELAGGKCELAGGYPGWKPNMKSPILTTMQATYNKLYGKEPKIMAIHAGLECGLFGTMYPNWDMISFGPTIMYPHSPDEKVNIASVGKFWDYLVETLKNIPVK
ncbi:MAG: M20/M25/M40 family metallo-hydrolase, partial [Bacteroidales bacterium]|nr:M20/M25/M40 family metallo-hydrolase [Bacteroidales bacterium]